MSELFYPPAPKPRTTPPNLLQLFWIIYKNPIELWAERSYKEPYVYVTEVLGGPLLVANDPSLIKHVLVDKTSSFKLAKIRQLLLRPILKDGLLTIEETGWKRSRKAMAPVFTPRHIHGFAQTMQHMSAEYVSRYDDTSKTFDMAHDMTELTFLILVRTLFSDQVEVDMDVFAKKLDVIFNTMTQVSPMDILGAPSWVPRLGKLRGHSALKFFRNVVREGARKRKAMMENNEPLPTDFLTLLLQAQGDGGLTPQEVEDNIFTFMGAGHETTARALGWTIYLLSKAPQEREKVEQECKQVMSSTDDPLEWVKQMPYTQAAFEEAMRLYPPAPTISRDAVEDTVWNDLTIQKKTNVLIMPWVIHRHRKYWNNPDAFDPSRFLPENRDKIKKYQYMPFGAGPRICIGSSFAMQEALIILGTLFSRYRFDMAEGAEEPWPLQQLTIKPSGGLHMNVTKL